MGIKVKDFDAVCPLPPKVAFSTDSATLDGGRQTIPYFVRDESSN
jgi:hypothetical protein